MPAKAEKIHGRKQKSVAQHIGQTRLSATPSYPLVDNRRVRLAQKGLIQLADNGVQRMQPPGILEMANVVNAQSQPVQAKWVGEIPGNINDTDFISILKEKGFDTSGLNTWKIKSLRESRDEYSTYEQVAEKLKLNRSDVVKPPKETAIPEQHGLLPGLDQATSTGLGASPPTTPIPERQAAPPQAGPAAATGLRTPPRALGGERILSPVELNRRQIAAKAKHALLESISKGIQNKRNYEKLKPGILDGTETSNQRAIKINMALRNPETQERVVTALVGEVPKEGPIREVLAELSTMPLIDPNNISDTAIGTFAHYTREGYENVTGIAKGNVRWDKQGGQDRPMTEAEIERGTKTLAGLKTHWREMPKFPGNTVYRVIHDGTDIGSLAEGASLTKPNPTSTSVSLDWSRVKDGKTSCKINILESRVENRPVDIRAVSTYTHEGEILLPPGTRFTRTGTEGNFMVFDAQMPENIQ